MEPNEKYSSSSDGAEQPMRGMTLEERTVAASGSSVQAQCSAIRAQAKKLQEAVAAVMLDPEFEQSDNPLAPGNIPPSRNSNAKANMTLAFRHLEDACMRLGKVMQAMQGGTSILDK